MSVMGSGIAAGVAGAPLSSRQVNQTKSSRDAAAAKFAEQLTSAEPPEKLKTEDADEQLPDNQAPGYEALWRKRLAQQPETPENADAAPMPTLDDELYHHIDVQA